MKHLATVLFVAVAALILAGIWLPAYLWQFLGTALVVLVAAVAVASAEHARRQQEAERIRNAGLRFVNTPARPTQTQAQVDAEFRRMQGGDQ